MSGLTILYRMTGNSQNFARIKLGIKLISDSVFYLRFFFKSSLTILHRMAGNSQKFARIKLGIKLIYDSVSLFPLYNLAV